MSEEKMKTNIDINTYKTENKKYFLEDYWGKKAIAEYPTRGKSVNSIV